MQNKTQVATSKTSRRRFFHASLAGLLSVASCSIAAGAETDGLPTHNARVVPEIEWDTAIKHFQIDSDKFLGQRLTVMCPPAPRGVSLSGLSGTDRYPSESSICVAALHAGMMSKDGGIVTLQLVPCKSKYEASARGDVTSSALPPTPRSIRFVDPTNLDEADKERFDLLPRIKWDTKFTSTGFARRNLVGQQITLRCPPAPANLKPGLVFGTDRYEFSTRVAVAALHAGAISKDGGLITIQIDPGVESFVGSIRNGVETKSKGGSDRSLTFVRSTKDASELAAK